MKKIQLLTTVFTVIVIFFCNSITAQDVLWYGDPNKDVKSSFRRFDSGNFPKDYCSDQSNNGSNASTVNDSKYGKVWRIRKPKGQKRGEFARTTGTVNNFEPKDGQTLYYGWRWKIESNPTITSGVAVWQWKTDAAGTNNTQNYPLNMGYGNGKLSLGAWGPYYPRWNDYNGSISDRKVELWEKSVAPGTWVSIVIKIKLSRDEDKGEVELWFNGEKQKLANGNTKNYKVGLSADSKTAYHKTMDGKVMYPKWGSYNSNACSFNITTYYDNMRIAKTLAAATPDGTTNNPTINQAPSVSFKTPTGNITVDEGYKLKVEANASDPDGSISNVKLYINNALIRQEVNPPYEWGHAGSPNPDELNGRKAGTYTVKAVATDNKGKTATRSFTMTVKGNDPGNQAPKVSFKKPNGDLTVDVGYKLTAEVNASDPDGSISNVKLYINNSLIRQENYPPYEWGHATSPNPNELNNRGAGTYTLKAVATDNKGATAETSIKLTVKGNTNPNPGGDCNFGTPISKGISAKDKVVYNNVYILGNGGPSLSNFRKFTINWVPSANGLYQFAINTNDANPDWYVDFKNTMSYQLKNAQPEVTLNNTGFAGLDGTYWVAETSNSFILVSKTKGYSIHFSNASSAPTCSNKNSGESYISELKADRNPFNHTLTLSGIPKGAYQTIIYDYSGKKILQIPMNGSSTQISIDTTNLFHGIYFAQVFSEESSIPAIKVIKQ